MVITREQFDSLLDWLGSDREFAGRKYETIRTGLIRVFVSQGFSDAEDLADETINRVTTRLADIRDGYVGEQARYFHGVARNVIRETRRRKEINTEVAPISVDLEPTIIVEYDCLERCLGVLPPTKRELILDYYLYEGHDKIEHHKQMAWQLSITEGALRGRAHHTRAKLEKCVRECAGSQSETKPTPIRIVSSSAAL